LAIIPIFTLVAKKNFNVRVYGILIYKDALLVSDEYIKGNKITKLPGGGLEFGEGTRECLAREFKEELELDVEVTDHFYTTDFYVSSAFDTNSQVISIYYVVTPKSAMSFKTSINAHNYENKEGAQSLRWIKLKDLKEADFTLIIDRKVGEMLMKQFT
jgi:ADP-ribose pyrophosphatase YjhB (NUDIX family)